VVYSEAEGMKPLRELDYSGISVYRERPFFTCYIDGLDV